MRIPITVTKQEFKKLKKLYKGTKNDVKFVEVDDETFDKLESAFNSLREQGRKNEQDKDDKWYIHFTDKQLKELFDLTDEEIKNLHKKQKIS